MHKDEKSYDKQRPITLPEMHQAAEKRVSLISKEFKEGFDFLINYSRSVTVFGSTATKPGEKYYEKAVNIAGRIVKELRYSVITGGGPGIMEAANKGAYEAGGNSLGLTIDLPNGQIVNRYLTDTVGFHYFFSRKVCLAFSAEAYIFFPGGFGTLDEFTEIVTLVQTHKIKRVPIILVGEEYWKPLLGFFKERLLAEGMIDPEDLQLFVLTDDDDRIIDMVKKSPIEIGVSYKGGYNNNIDIKKGNKADRPISKFLRWF